MWLQVKGVLYNLAVFSGIYYEHRQVENGACYVVLSNSTVVSHIQRGVAIKFRSSIGSSCATAAIAEIKTGIKSGDNLIDINKWIEADEKQWVKECKQ